MLKLIKIEMTVVMFTGHAIFAFLCLVSVCFCQLVVNVKNNGGDVYRENIEANTTQDTIVLEFRKADGTVVTQFIDGRNVRNSIRPSFTNFVPAYTSNAAAVIPWPFRLAYIVLGML